MLCRKAILDLRVLANQVFYNQSKILTPCNLFQDKNTIFIKTKKHNNSVQINQFKFIHLKSVDYRKNTKVC